jgi:hypothetical protein
VVASTIAASDITVTDCDTSPIVKEIETVSLALTVTFTPDFTDRLNPGISAAKK